MSPDPATIVSPDDTPMSLAAVRQSGGPAESTLRREIAAGRLPAERIGREYLVRPSDVIRLGIPPRRRRAADPVDELLMHARAVAAQSPALRQSQSVDLAHVLGSLLAGEAR